MGQLIPTPVRLEDLMTIGSNVNLFNDGIETQATSPRTKGEEVITVQVTDDPLAAGLASGTANQDVINSLVDTTTDFVAAGVSVGDSVINTTDNTVALVTDVTSVSLLTLDADIFPAGTDDYIVVGKSYWVQKSFNGEWVRSGARTGNDETVTYTYAVAGGVASSPVHGVVYPVADPKSADPLYPPIQPA